ncbi:MAG: LysM peptidoglycan-binding domain-containing protein [Gemmatimonadetes bacterium]|nr:LysM peptidoglycan-binding domain-containing protein [Gemmatimonadota bacterium]MYA63121.1 LysM peptidoglycan-binding domain-containing protein [Gemmatimonadota bacterium]MYC00235.1 LysM peptidoglycan-binding domain-containing protein [Gemmatimonadota bacterium]MYH53503.1 LysM peptidoglycan-binding domain-containing protein [Gemmatimonadota bacterium]MYI45643.1 LysM peptidoglycan-binding domain-containing protein [Gemmatimonadota bacterium]
MAVDLRRSNTPACRTWIQRVLLQLEGSGTIQATHERRPPHYHIAVYTREYARYVAQLEADNPTVAGTETVATAEAAAGAGASAGASGTSFVSYRVRPGDSLWRISREYGITVSQLKLANKLTSSRIYAGQWLEVPVSSR